MDVLLTLDELSKIIADASELGAKRALISTGALKAFLSASQAYKIYGRSNVDRWIKEGLISPQKDGDKNTAVRLDRMLLESIAASSNRISFFRLQR